MLMIIVSALCAMEATPAHNRVWGDDFNSPAWRGQERATFQRWEFGTNSKTSPPEDDYTNPHGVPNLSVTGDAAVWIPQDLGEQGVWKFEDYVVVEIADFNEPYPFKEVWMQLTYTASGSPLVYADTVDGRFWGRKIYEEPAGSYFHAIWQIVIEPNPAFETIYIEPRDCTMYMDEVVIDTICTFDDPLCIVELRHFALFAEHWLDTGCDAGNEWCGGADLNGLGEVDWLDLEMLLYEWLDYCPHPWPLK
jgi:hypothetical protein